MIRLRQDAGGGITPPPANTGMADAVVTASWMFHPPGVIRLVTPAETVGQARQAARAPRVSAAEHDATGDDR